MAELMAAARRPWWVISGAAAALYGEDSIPVSDVDILLDRQDAESIACRLGIPASPGAADDRFHSAVFFRWMALPLAVEFMADFRVREGERWEPIMPRSRCSIGIGHQTVYVPAMAELIEMFQRFGRVKDLRRADRLRKIASGRASVP
ncbi:hypothetical protein ACYJW8_15910 [Frateuria aurantia]